VRVIIAGPRDLWPTRKQIFEAIADSGFQPHAIITGGAKGVDRQVYQEVRDGALYIPITVAPRWEFWRRLFRVRVAGPERNRLMAQIGEALIVIKRKGIDTIGTSQMMREARKAGIPIHIKEID
jgi:hypothetical protein